MSGLSSMVFIGTTGGMYRMSIPTGEVLRMALPGQYVNYVFYKRPMVLAACPSFGALHQSMGITSEKYPTHCPGLHMLNNDEDSSIDDDASSRSLWQGDARSCAAMETEQGVTRLLIGVEPADVLRHDDIHGAAPGWQGQGSFMALPTRHKWSFPPPPHQPHVLSFDFGEDDDGCRLLVVGVEVGGCVVSKDSGVTWEERSSGLCPDVHSIRVDPQHGKRWYAVTGGGTPPGGLYVTENSGKTWRRLSTGLESARYLVGLAISPFHPGHLLLTAGDGPPSRGTHIYSSIDAGHTFTDLTQIVKAQLQEQADIITQQAHPGSGEPGLSMEDAWSWTPVPLFTKQGALLATCTGEVLLCPHTEPLQLGPWRCVAKLPHKINALMADDELGSPSTVSH